MEFRKRVSDVIVLPVLENDVIRNVRYAQTLEVGDVVALMTAEDPYGFWLASVTTKMYRQNKKALIGIQWFDRYRVHLFKPLETCQTIDVNCLIVVPLKISLMPTLRDGVLKLDSARMILEAGERRYAEIEMPHT